MKRLALLVAAAGVAYLAWQRAEDDRRARALWAEVTDSLD